MSARRLVIWVVGVLLVLFLGTGASVRAGTSAPVSTPSTQPTTPSATPTAATTPTPSCCADVTTGTSWAQCATSLIYGYSFNVNNNCTEPATGYFAFYLEVSPNQDGPWSNYQNLQPLTQT